MSRKNKIIYLEWLDASTKGGWHMPNDCALIKCSTVGWLMDETKEHVTVAATFEHESNGMISSNTIPKAWIKKRKYLKGPQ